MISHTALLQITAPIRCTSSTRRKSSSVILANDLSRRMPALLTRMSMRPQRSITCATIAATAASSVTAPATASASPPAATLPATTRSAASSPRSLTTTRAPWRARNNACSRPSPPPAPVTIATRPLSVMLLRSSSLVRPAGHSGADIHYQQSEMTMPRSLIACAAGPSYHCVTLRRVALILSPRAGPDIGGEEHAQDIHRLGVFGGGGVVSERHRANVGPAAGV